MPLPVGMPTSSHAYMHGLVPCSSRVVSNAKCGFVLGADGGLHKASAGGLGGAGSEITVP